MQMETFISDYHLPHLVRLLQTSRTQRSQPGSVFGHCDRILISQAQTFLHCQILNKL